jgi:hypothetical protein
MKAAEVPISKRILRKLYWVWRHWLDDARTRAQRALDRPGLRWLLSASVTRRARSIAQDSRVSVFYDEMWIDRVDGTSVPRSRRFNYSDWHLQHLREHLRGRLDGSVDFWTSFTRRKRATSCSILWREWRGCHRLLAVCWRYGARLCL